MRGSCPIEDFGIHALTGDEVGEILRSGLAAAGDLRYNDGADVGSD